MICNHGMGISRIDFSIPVTSFEHYPGLSGNVLSVVDFRNQLYAGTSEGLYLLDEVKGFKEVVVNVKEKVIQSQKIVDELESKAVVTEHEKKRKSFFSRLFDKIAGGKATDEKTEVSTDQSKAQASREYLVRKKKVLALQPVGYAYRKVAGLEGKCRQLVVVNDELLVVSSRGIYSVLNDKAKPILFGKYTLFAFPSGFNKDVIWIGTENGLERITKSNEVWTTTTIFLTENDLPVSVAELSAKQLLLTTESRVIRLTLNEAGAASPALASVMKGAFDSPVARTIMGNTMLDYVRLVKE